MDINNPTSETYCTEKNNTEKLSPELLRRYIKMRKILDTEANSIYSITSLLMHYKSCGDNSLKIDPIALSNVCQTMNDNILNIQEILNDFIYIVQAKSDLEQLESEL